MRTQPGKLLVVFTLLLITAISVPAASAQGKQMYVLTVMHTNDEHSHHDLEGGAGGMAREATVVKQFRASVKNTLLVDGGDRFTGTLYHRQYLGQENAQLMNTLGYQAMTLGNHEFDNGDEVLGKFIDALKFPVVSSNIDFGASKPLAGKTQPLTVIEVGGEKIGFIGLTTADTAFSSSASKEVKFSGDYPAAVQGYVDKLTAQGINKIILLTHIGYEEDLKLAAQVSGVDLIVGGHSHTLLSNTYNEAGKLVYPAKAKSKSGEPVYIVQAGSYGKYLGRIDLQFDSAGIIQQASGDTILLSQYITPDPTVEKMLKDFSAPFEELKTKPIQTVKGDVAATTAAMSIANCRLQECELGNFIADAMRAKSGAQIAIENGGGIRAGLNEGPVTVAEVMTILPFGNTLATFKLKGSDVVAALENGVSKVGGDSGTGRFPQVSGLRFTFDTSKPIGSRVSDVQVMNQDGKYAAIDPATIYSVVSNDFERRGGDEYTVFANNAIDPYDFGPPLDQVFMDYLAANSPLSPKIEGRITKK